MANVKISDIATEVTDKTELSWCEGEKADGSPAKFDPAILGGGSALGPDWTDLTFGSTSTIVGSTSYAANETIVAAVGSLIEFEAYVYKTDADTAQAGFVNASGYGFYAAMQSDGNPVAYLYNSGGSSALGAVGSDTDNDYTGITKLAVYAIVHAASNNRLRYMLDDYRLPTIDLYTSASVNLVGTLTPFVMTADISKCYARARVIG